jgi:hypothetical protein
MRKPTRLVILVLSAILGCSKDSGVAIAPHEELRATPPVFQPAAAPAALLAAADRGKDKKADKSKDAKDLPTGWSADYAQALAKANSTGQPLVILFH